MIECVVCLWKFNETSEKPWMLIESHVIDDGYSAKGMNYKDLIYNWTHKNEKEIMGRAVTMWGLSSGIHLICWHPQKWIDALSSDFLSILYKSTEWCLMVKDGHDPYFKTLEEVRKHSKL